MSLIRHVLVIVIVVVSLGASRLRQLGLGTEGEGVEKLLQRDLRHIVVLVVVRLHYAGVRGLHIAGVAVDLDLGAHLGVLLELLHEALALRLHLLAVHLLVALLRLHVHALEGPGAGGALALGAPLAPLLRVALADQHHVRQLQFAAVLLQLRVHNVRASQVVPEHQISGLQQVPEVSASEEHSIVLAKIGCPRQLDIDKHILAGLGPHHLCV
mmetsp:Transcript_38429/g.64564  ORF Transcript_38429/g.64564 Transcript_38429/m.64564 type:complete len:213 (+) Transcript_38429:543-1181(+)